MDRKSEIRASLGAAREKTLWLMSFVSDEFLRRRVHSFYSPIGWHFGHVGRTEEYWVINRALGQEVLDDKLTFLFHDCPENPKENRVNIPPRSEILLYLKRTRCRVLEALDVADLSSDNPFLEDGYAWEFAMQHECQHQETIAEMLQLIQKELLMEPASAERPGVRRLVAALASLTPTERDVRAATSLRTPGRSALPVAASFVPIEGGSFLMGSNWRHGYDNEKCEHEVEVASFELAETQVTAGQWLQFMADGGYERQEIWSAEGWAWRCTDGAQAPEYWHPVEDGYLYIGPLGLREIDPLEPVSSISWFEADAFARWAGGRLPTEEEWEYARKIVRWHPCGVARPSPVAKGQPLEHLLGELCPIATGDGRATPNECHPPTWQPGPVVAGPEGMAGGVWEWMSSKFLPYPGFQAFPYDGYSKDHMEGEHFVCRGGSWATAEPILRCTFRNWYVPTYRQGFLGMRLAR